MKEASIYDCIYIYIVYNYKKQMTNCKSPRFAMSSFFRTSRPFMFLFHPSSSSSSSSCSSSSCSVS